MSKEQKTVPPLNIPPNVELQWDESRRVHILTQEGKAKLCPYQNEVIPGSKIAGVGRDNAIMSSKPCNTDCALLKLSLKQIPPQTGETESTVKVVASLGCSGPVSYELGGTPKAITDNNSSNHLTIEK